MSLQQLFGILGAASVGTEVSLNTAGVTNLSENNPTIAGVAYNLSGAEAASNSAGSYVVSRGNWLDTGNNFDVWFERTINTGSLNDDDPGDGRLIMTSTRTVAVRDNTIPGGPVTCNLTITMWDAASGGSKLDEVTYTLSAQRESGA